MKVHQVVQIIQDWVKEHTAQSPGYLGTHLIGGIAHLSSENVFSPSHTVHVGLIIDGCSETQNIMAVTSYEGIVIEYTIRSHHEYLLEAVLSNPELMSNFVGNSLIDDPSGHLRHLQSQVRSEYSRKEWVHARCDFEYAHLMMMLERMDHFPAPTAQAALFQSALSHLAGLVAVAHLKPPTTRRSFAAMCDLLHATNHVDIHEYVLEIAGFAHMTRRQVESYLIDATEAFDKAISIRHLPHSFDYKLHPLLRPSLVEGSRELIEAGYHREALSWISMFYLNCCDVIERDGNDTEKAHFGAQVRGFLSDLGLSSRFKRKDRSELARVFSQEIYNMMD